MVILTDKNEVHFSGIGLAFKPVIFDMLPEGIKVKSVSCCYNSIFVLSEDNVIYSNTEE